MEIIFDRKQCKMGERTESSKKYLTDLLKRLKKRLYPTEATGHPRLHFYQCKNDELKNRIQRKQSDTQINSSAQTTDEIPHRLASLILHDPYGLGTDNGDIRVAF